MSHISGNDKPGYRIWIRIVCKQEIHLLLRNARNPPSSHACDQWSASASFKYFPYFFVKRKIDWIGVFLKSGFIDKPPNPRIHQAFFRVFPCTKTLDNQFDCPPWWKFPNIKDGSSKQDEISYINPRQIHPPFQTVTLTGPFLYIQPHNNVRVNFNCDHPPSGEPPGFDQRLILHRREFDAKTFPHCRAFDPFHLTDHWHKIGQQSCEVLTAWCR
jgi:hypothetical protein